MYKRHLWIAAPSLVALIACSSENNGDSVLRARVVLQVGDADGRAALASIEDVEVSPSGEILVAQAAASEVAVFDSTGTLRMTFGRSGDGPGEFSNVWRMGWVGDKLWVLDAGRIHLYDGAYAPLETIAPEFVTGSGGAPLVAGPLLADGSIVGIPTSGFGEPAWLVIADRNGTTRRRLTRLQPDAQFRSVEIHGVSALLIHPWARVPFWIPDADGSAILVAEESGENQVDLRRFDLAGRAPTVTTLFYSPRPLQQADVQSYYETTAHRLARQTGGNRAEIQQLLREGVAAPETYPLVAGFVAGRDSSVWLARAGQAPDSLDWEVLDTRFARLLTVRLPASLRVHRAERGRIWASSTDSIGVPRVVVLAF